AKRIVAVDEDRDRANLDNSADRRNECVCAGDDLVTMADAQCLQGELDGVGSGIHANRMFCADKIGKAPLKLDQRLAKGKIAGRHECTELLPQVVALRELLPEV